MKYPLTKYVFIAGTLVQVFYKMTGARYVGHFVTEAGIHTEPVSVQFY